MDVIGLKTNVVIEARDPSGRLVNRIRRHNLVTLAGRNLIRDALNGTVAGIGLDKVAVGTGSTAVAPEQTALVAEADRGPISQRVLDDGSLTVQRYLTTADANGVSIQEAGLFAGSVMLARVVFPEVAKTSDLTVTITWTVSIGAA